MTKTAAEYVSEVDIKAHAERLADILGEGYAQIMALAYDEGAKQTGANVSFELTNPRVVEAIKKLGGKRIKAMAATTKADLISIITKALEGERDPETDKLNVPSTAQIAKRVREAGIENSRWRSDMLARSETAVAYNVGAVVSYRDAGLTHVEVLDGDKDEECASVDGTTQTLEWAEENPTGHPNCTRAFVGVVE